MQQGMPSSQCYSFEACYLKDKNHVSVFLNCASKPKNSMKKLLLTAAAVVFMLSTSFGQLSENIAPKTSKLKVANLVGSNIPVVTMPPVDVETLMAEDEINNATKSGPFRFGETMDVTIDFSNSGLWNVLPNGDRIWRVVISSPNAYSLNFIFNDFYMPQGATLHIYDERGESMMGAFTSKNNLASGDFATYLLPSDLAVIEYFEPLAVAGQGRLGMNQVIHGYRDILNGFDPSRGGGSGACNNNVACPEGDPWENEINAVTRIVLGGGLCSGSLITDVPQSGTPYYLTANHCIQGAGSGGNWVFNFNYQSSTCNGTSGSLSQSLTGCSIKASNAGSDFALVQLNNTPPAAYGAFYAGWDNSGASPTNQVGIHHPSGDIKKISFDNNPATNANFGGAACWRIATWEDGTTEGGSSGSPLFDQNHRIIGQLYGGEASCSNNVNDYYGRFGVSWATGSTASTRLRDWLDPQNTGTTAMDGFDPNAPAFALDASSQALSGVEDGATICAQEVIPVYTLRNAGSTTLTSAVIDWAVDGVPQTAYSWTGTLNAGQSANITFPTQNFSAGAHSLSFNVASVNGGSDMNSANDVISASFTIVVGDELTLNLTTDNYGDETSWEITDDQNNVVASGSGYGDATQYTVPSCLADGCYTFTIFDEYGDGICCQYGNGSFSIVEGDGDILGSGSEFTDELSIDFCLPYVPPAPSASFAAQTTEVCKGQTVSFTNNSTPNVGVTYAWTFQGGSPTNNTTQNPTVTYNSPGTFDVTLTVTNSAGSDTYTLTDYITINPTPTATTSSIGENLWTGGNNGTATVNASGGTEPYTYAWSPGGGNTQTIEGLTAGNYSVTVSDVNGCQATATVSVGNNVGINDVELANAISVYPNPTSSVLNIEVPVEANVIDVTISDLSGRMVHKVNVTGLKRIALDLGGLAEGIYHLNFFTNDSKATKKVVLLNH